MIPAAAVVPEHKVERFRAALAEAQPIRGVAQARAIVEAVFADELHGGRLVVRRVLVDLSTGRVGVAFDVLPIPMRLRGDRKRAPAPTS
jgi:hypothetical protein